MDISWWLFLVARPLLAAVPGLIPARVELQFGIAVNFSSLISHVAICSNLYALRLGSVRYNVPLTLPAASLYIVFMLIEIEVEAEL